jgi:3-oxoadipate enol-lactonase
MQHRTHDGLTLYYELQGKSTAPVTLVFLNGLTQSTASWSLITPYFENNYRILLLDFIFQGQSDKNIENRNFDEHARDVSDLLEALKIEQPVIIGLSYGSLVAQHFAVNYPKRLSKLILLSTFAKKNPYYLAIELSWSRALDFGGYPLLLDVMLPFVISEGYFANPLIPIEAMKTARQGMNRDASAIKKLMTATEQRPEYLQELKKIKCPALIVQGERDLLLPVYMGKEVADHIPGARFEMIPGAGHTLNLEAIPQVTAAIGKFIA